MKENFNNSIIKMIDIEIVMKAIIKIIIVY